MITLPFVKRSVVELLTGRDEFQSVAVNYGPPELSGDVAGDNPLVAQHTEFGDPDGDLQIDEHCGPGVQEYFERYTLPLTIEVVARNRDATPEFVDDNRAQLVWETVQALQDPTLGHTVTKDDRLSQLICHAAAEETESGWLIRNGSNLYAARTTITLAVEAKVQNE